LLILSVFWIQRVIDANLVHDLVCAKHGKVTTINADLIYMRLAFVDNPASIKKLANQFPVFWLKITLTKARLIDPVICAARMILTCHWV